MNSLKQKQKKYSKIGRIDYRVEIHKTYVTFGLNIFEIFNIKRVF
jgi:hypothetical protein